MNMHFKTVRIAIKEQIDREQIGIDVFTHLVEVFQPFVGKKISERMITALNKNLPTGFSHATLKRIASLIQVVLIPELPDRVWAGKTEKKLPTPADTQTQYENRITFLLGYEAISGKTNGTIFSIGHAESEHSGFAYYNNCYGGAAKERNDIRRRLLGKVTLITGKANTYATGMFIAENAKSELVELVGYQMEAEMTKILGMNQK